MWEKPAEGNPIEAGQARMQIRIHVQSDGAPVGPKRARSSLNALSDIPDSITSWNLAGTLRWLDRIRAAETAFVQVCHRIWTTVDTTIEEGEIISKSASLTRWRDRLPERWQVLLDEAWRLRHHLLQPSLYHHRFQRMSETLAFIQYGRIRGSRALDAYS
jgi:hypothetical protein